MSRTACLHSRKTFGFGADRTTTFRLESENTYFESVSCEVGDAGLRFELASALAKGGLVMRTFLLTMFLSVSAVFGGEGEPVHHSFRYHHTYGEAKELNALTFSPDSRQLAVSISDQVDLIDTQAGEITSQFKASPFSMGYTHDGQRLYMISYGQAQLLEVKSGIVLPTEYRSEKGFFGLGFKEHNGKLLVDSLWPGGSAEASKLLQPGDELVGFGEGQNGPMRRMTGLSVKSAIDVIAGVAGTYARIKVLPRGKYGASNERTVVLRRYAAARDGGSLQAPQPLILPKTLAWCMVDKLHQFRDAESGRPVAHLETIDIENIGLYAISPDQSKFAVVARRKDREGNAVEVFDLATQSRLVVIPLSKSSFFDIKFAADNNRVLIGTWDSVEIADTAKHMVVAQMTLGYQLPRARDSYQRSGTIASTLVDTVREELAGTLPSYGQSPRQLLANLAVSAGNVVAVGDTRGNIGMWDLDSGKNLKNIAPDQEDEVSHLEFSPDGKWLAYYIAGTLHVEDVSDVAELNAPKTEQPQNVDELVDTDDSVTLSDAPESE